MAFLAPARRFIGPVAPRLVRRPRPAPTFFSLQQRRRITADERPLPTKDTPGKGPTEDPLPHVSEEAAKTAEIMGETGPELDHGTPVQEMLQRDKEAAAKAPQVLKADANAKTKPPSSNSRSFSTRARRRRPVTTELESSTPPPPPMPSAPAPLVVPGLKFAPPTQLTRQDHLKSRYPEMIQRCTRYLMHQGKLAQAQTTMARILNHLRTSAPPRVSPERPLHPDAPPASQLPLNPVEYFACAVDSIAPLVRLRNMKGLAGGGASLQVPQPLTLWQRRRQAMVWILDAVSKKRQKGSGHGVFALKVAEELVAIVEGKSSLWDRRQALHRLSTAARANLAKAEAVKRGKAGKR